MAKPTVDELIGAVERVRCEQVRVSVRHVGRERLLDLRVWYEEGGQWKPSARGITLKAQEWTQLREILAKLKRQKGGENGQHG